ncbi:hypothetical protein QYF61_008972 [Mycteria americana]|uniref:Uncharacterized protein n=1 Tax=Mycteria americana TaxID=33587 RepID=A0AAN7PZC5_MYCAM|nr:hypothetical protein QYF61_008972 [Mycteria americana]
MGSVGAEQAQLSQPFLIGEVLQLSDHFCGPPLDPLQQVHVFPVLRTPELDAALQVGSHQSRAEGQNHLPRPAGHAAFDAAQDTVGFLGCECTLSAHVQLFIHQYPQVLLHRAALNPFISQPVLIPGVALTQVQDPALGLVEPHEVPIDPLLQLVQVPLDGIPSLRRVNHTTQLGVICKLAEGAFDPTVHVTDEGVKQYWSQYRPLRLNNPSSLSRSSEDFCSRPFTSFVALLWTRSSTSMSLLHSFPSESIKAEASLPRPPRAYRSMIPIDYEAITITICSEYADTLHKTLK